MKKLSIIIVTYNSVKHIYDCLKSIFQYNDIGDALEIVIVDNHSKEQSQMFIAIKEEYRNRVILVDSGKNGGYGFGNNIGVRHCSSDFFIVMNPDVRLVSPIFKNLIEEFENSQIGMIGVDFVDGSSAYYYKRGCGTTLSSLFSKYYLKYEKYDPKRMFLSGSFLVFRKSAFIEADMFDENIFMYSEEADIINRMLLKGYQVRWCPNIKVQHLAHGRQYNMFLDKIRLQSGRYYDLKYGIDSEKVFRTTQTVLRIKIIVANLINNKEKANYFKQMLSTLQLFHEEGWK